jgi:quercetin dioxygenase-like cupin family protein
VHSRGAGEALYAAALTGHDQAAGLSREPVTVAGVHSLRDGYRSNHDGRIAMDEQVSGQLQSFDSNTMPWGELYIDQLKVGVPLKAFVEDPDTGMSVQMIRYEAGFTNPWHRHNCAHGIYVLDGMLKTHAGTFGPGSFLWFPEGMMMEHGATEERDVVTLFITNKPFDIHYAFEDEEQSGQT